MSNGSELVKDIYIVGVKDRAIRSFHGYTTDFGTSYNAYLIIDEKIALIDTVKEEFSDELIENIRKIVEPEKISYIISNHVEMDHSGSIPKIMKLCPGATIVTSTPKGIEGLREHYGEYNFKEVKSGDELSLGKRTLQFVGVPMLHWPDSMVTYCPEEKILFSNDAFGQHYASEKDFDDEDNIDVILEQAKKYYSNIVMPFGIQVQTALKVVKSLDLELIATSHGLIWRKYIKEIIEAYDKWSNNETYKKAVIIYDTMWHSTEKIAHAIAKGFEKANVEVKTLNLKENHISDIITFVLDAEYIVVGSPTLNNNMMSEVAAFLTYMKGLAPKKRKGFAFGSYGWSGQSIEQVEEQMRSTNIEIVLDMIRIQYIPKEEQLQEIENSVYNLVK